MGEMNKFHLSSGYFIGQGNERKIEVFRQWDRNNKKADQTPHRTTVLSVGKSPIPSDFVPDLLLELDGNIGHCGAIIDKSKPYPYSGFSIAIMLLALVAYNDECDLIFKEQDCLAFGPWVSRMYRDCEGKQMVVGRPEAGYKAVSSLFLVKHSFLLQFVHWWSGSFPETDQFHVVEHKMEAIKKEFNKEVGAISFGYDRTRPFKTTDPVFYVQQPTDAELKSLTDQGFL